MKRIFRSALAAACVTASAFATMPVLAEEPMVKTQAPGFYRLMLGEFEITALSDGTNKLSALRLLQGDSARTAD